MREHFKFICEVCVAEKEKVQWVVKSQRRVYILTERQASSDGN